MNEGAGDNSGASGDTANDGKGDKPSSAGEMQKEVERGQAPRGIKSVDKGRVPFEKDNAHTDDGRALNNDGTWKHGDGDVSKKIKKWLGDHGWKVPR